VLSCRFGITPHDIFRGVNDTTNSALLTGRLIAENRVPENQTTTCHMHTQELVLQHALGIRERTRMGEPWDTFPEGKALVKKVKKLVGYVMKKQDKNRFQNYHDYCKKTWQISARKLVNPNDTRVSGIYFMFESVLRSYKCLTRFTSGSIYKNEYTDLMLSTNEWQLLAEFYSTMKVMNVLAMTSQKQTLDANCFSYYSVAHARWMIESAKKLNVIELSSHYHPSTDLSKVPQVSLELEQLNPLTQTFMKRLVKEFDFYFKYPDGDQTKMMIFNPVMVWRGLK
jgi:hypothetical protein